MRKTILILILLVISTKLYCQLDTLIPYGDINKQRLFVSEESAIREFSNGQPVYRLLLSSKGYTELPSEICEIISLQELQMPWNDLTKLNLEMSKLVNLQSLNLTWNSFRKFPVEICELKNLRFLNISGNGKKELPAEFANLKNLEHLILTGFNFKEFPTVLTHLPNLKILVLSDCNIREIPMSFCNLSNIKTLVLSNNRLKTLPDCIFTMQITNLNLEGNRFNRKYNKEYLMEAEIIELQKHLKEQSNN